MTDYSLDDTQEFDRLSNTTVTDTTPAELHERFRDEDYQDRSVLSRFIGNQQYPDDEIFVNTVDSLVNNESIKPHFLNGVPVSFDPSDASRRMNQDPLTVVEDYCDDVYGIGAEPGEWGLKRFEVGSSENPHEDQRGYVTVSADLPVSGSVAVGNRAETVGVEPWITGEISIEGELSGVGERTDLEGFKDSLSPKE